MPVRDDVRGDDADAALARALQQSGGIAPAALARCLDELRARREREPGLSLAALLLDRGLVDAGALERARARLAAAAPPPPAGDLGRGPRLPERFGPYRVVRELARGGMGLVLEVEHEATGARYALKTVISYDPDALLRFRREAEVLGRLDHPNVVRVHAASLEARPPWLVVALLTGGTLARRLREGGPLPPEEAVPLVATLARAMAHAHARGVLHRDLKPENVLFDDQGAPCIVDFGLARETDAGACRLTLTGEVMGTPSFMAPEQALGTVADARADVWGLGAVLFAALTGRPPFDCASPFAALQQVLTCDPVAPGRQRPGLSPALDAVVLRALAREREARFASAGELAAALEALIVTRGAARRAPRVAPLVATAAALTVAALTVAALAARPHLPAPPPSATERAQRGPAPPVAGDPPGALPAWLRGTPRRADVIERAREAPLAEVQLALASLEREPDLGSLDDLRRAAWLRLSRTDLPLVDEARGRRVFERWIAEARLAGPDAAREVTSLTAMCWGAAPIAAPLDLGDLERLAEAVGAALLLGRWNPYDLDGGPADPLLDLASLTSGDTGQPFRERLRDELGPRVGRTFEPLLGCVWVHTERTEGDDPAAPGSRRTTDDGLHALERLLAVMPEGLAPATRWRRVHDVLVTMLRWRPGGTAPEFVLREAARARAGSRVLLLAATHWWVQAKGEPRLEESLDHLRRAWALLERVPDEERDELQRRLRVHVETLALDRAPAWFVALSPSQRPPALLSPGVRWGERPGEYVQASDGAILEWADGAFRPAR